MSCSYQASENFNIEDLKKKCQDFISENTVSCLSTDAFLELSSECLKKLLESDSLSFREETIYKRVIDWARTHCQKQGLPDTTENYRKVLGTIVHKIHFPIMESDFFMNEVCTSGLLTKAEKTEVKQSFENQMPVHFSQKLRLSPERQIMCCKKK